MSIVLQGSTSGSITLQEPAIAGSTVLSLPATTGTVLTSASPASDLPSSINGPAFRAFRNGNQTISAATTTKVALNAESFDTANCFDSTTNYRFTPNVAGYYQVNATVGFNTGAGQAAIYKNGATQINGVEITFNASLGGHAPVSDLVYLNGSTDYIELYVYLTTGTTVLSGEINTVFSASMVRAA